MQPNAKTSKTATHSAIITAVSIIASQIAAKSARDAIFLSTFAIESLPRMLVAAALISIIMVPLSSRLMVRLTPIRLVPLAFVTSSLALGAIWLFMRHYPKEMAVLLYIHVTAFGVVLISGFWSLVNERFDPHTAKKTISQIVGGATLGGLVGGVLAERLASTFDARAVLWAMAGLHLVCAWKVRDLAPVASLKQDSKKPPSQRSPIKILKTESYLRHLAFVVLLVTVAAALLDYTYKAFATQQFQDPTHLTRFFAIYYVAVGLLTFLVQHIFSRWSLEKLGPAKTISILPALTSLGSLAAGIVPLLTTTTLARLTEAVTKSSLFRSGYELFFFPVAQDEKRATKTIIDVGFDRLGDALGGGVIQAMVFFFADAQLRNRMLLLLAAALSLLGFGIAVFLKRGYFQALRTSLLSRDPDDMPPLADRGTSTLILRTLTNLKVSEIAALNTTDQQPPNKKPSERSSETLQTPSLQPSLTNDPILQAVADLRSGDLLRISRRIDNRSALDPSLVGHIVPLLAWDAIRDHAISVLAPQVDQISGQLIDNLLNANQEFIIRRRIPLVLVHGKTQRVVDGLLASLADRRFEVRYQAGRALRTIHEKNKELAIAKRQIFSIANKELGVSQQLWKDRQLLDKPDDPHGLGFFDELLRNQANPSLEHVFTLLSLVLERKPLQVAFRALHTQDEMLRGTALEYLDVVLPQRTRKALWPLVGDISKQTQSAADIASATQKLLRTSMSIDAHLNKNSRV